MKSIRVILASGLIAGATILTLAPPVFAQPPATIGGDVFDNVPIGVDCGTFEVWDQVELHTKGKVFFDNSGNAVRLVQHV
jgi:hypothetical protein